jgi:hypothetical protein
MASGLWKEGMERESGSQEVREEEIVLRRE